MESMINDWLPKAFEVARVAAILNEYCSGQMGSSSPETRELVHECCAAAVIDGLGFYDQLDLMVEKTPTSRVLCQVLRTPGARELVAKLRVLAP
jgi:GH35 family endo-1,4-beta-xylanase